MTSQPQSNGQTALDSLEGRTLSPAGSPASPSPSQGNASDGTTSAGTSSGTRSSSPATSVRRSSSSKTFPASLHQIREALSERSSLTWPKQGFITSNGECLTPKTSESPNGGEEFSSSLAAILQSSVDVKYSLSVKACAGILRRAGRRGRTLPAPLVAALEAVALQQPSTPVATVEDSEPNRENTLSSADVVYAADKLGTLTTTFGSKNYSNVQEVSQGSIVVVNDAVVRESEESAVR